MADEDTESEEALHEFEESVAVQMLGGLEEISIDLGPIDEEELVEAFKKLSEGWEKCTYTTPLGPALSPNYTIKIPHIRSYPVELPEDKEWPHTCKKCGGPALKMFNSVDCKNKCEE